MYVLSIVFRRDIISFNVCIYLFKDILFVLSAII